ncbi:MAG TPA: hypothetical protein ENM97_00975 [Moorella mulderi]|nr:hypothetical protein [Moorella mulderi]
MTISASSIVLLRCPVCGHLTPRGISLFDFGGGRTFRLDCTCGTTLLVMGRRGSSFWIQYRCNLCDSIHTLTKSLKEIWSQEPLILTCKETEMVVGCLAPRGLVEVLTWT